MCNSLHNLDFTLFQITDDLVWHFLITQSILKNPTAAKKGGREKF